MSNTTESTFEGNIEAHLLANGWQSLAPDGYDHKLGLFPDEVTTWLAESQPKQWEHLSARHGGEVLARQKVVQAVADAIDHRGTLSVLRDGLKNSGVNIDLATFKPASGLNPDTAVRYAANRVAVVRQLHHSESRPLDSVDLALVVNGIPVATAELKNPLTGQGLEQAISQYRTDRNPHDLIFRARTLVHFAVDPHHVAMTTCLAGQDTRFLPFDQGSAGPGNPGTSGNPAASGYETAYLWEEVWQRDNWLELLDSFIQQRKDKKTGTWQVLFPRFHQWHAVRSILEATARDGAGVDRLIQHSAGSGKSNTIAWSAHMLSRLHGVDETPIFDKVVVITDRKVLDRQLQATVAGLEHTEGTVVRVDKNSAQLKAALEGNAARVIITTLQKFPVVLEIARDAQRNGKDAGSIAGQNFAVIVDEAHSSTSGAAMGELKTVLSGDAALDEAERAEATDGNATSEEEDALLDSATARGKSSNISFFAFTATPKPKTLNVFGQTGQDGIKRPFHTYSMRQAIAEGFILDVLANYTTYAVYYKLAKTHPRNDPSVEVRKGKAMLARNASLHSHMMEAKAEVIVEHFREKTAHKIDGRAKAMVVTRSRLHAVRTHKAIQDYISKMGYDRGPDAMKALVAFSGTVKDSDAPDAPGVTEAQLNGFSEGELPKKFHADYQVLVVAEKYQTGFDEPLLHTMYVDKKLSGVAAVQTLSRLNRIHDGKDDTFVLDFANTAEEIEKAFNPFYEQSLAETTDPQVLATMEHDLLTAGVLVPEEMERVVQLLLAGEPCTQGEMYSLLGTATGRFLQLGERDEEAAESFRGTLDSFCRAYSFLAQVMPWTDRDMERLFLYGRLLLAELPARESDPMPQVSKSVQLSHLRITATSSGAITLEGDEEPVPALPGGGKGSGTEPVTDKLSALIAVMNEKYGADLGDADRVWMDQQWTVVMDDDDLRDVARHNDRSQYEAVLDDRVGELILDREEANGELLSMFFGNLEFRKHVVSFLAGTYDEFRRAG